MTYNSSKRHLPLKTAIRRTTSLALLLSGVILVVSSVALFIAPPAHVAFFSAWRLAGLSKPQWNALHLVGGVFFILGVLLHTFYNWRAMMLYLRGRERRVAVFTTPFITALVLTAAMCVCSILFLPPARQIMHLGHTINQKHLRTYSVFPCGDLKMYTLTKVSRYLGVDTNWLVDVLQENGIAVSSIKQSIYEIAQQNGIAPQSVLNVILVSLHSARMEGFDDAVEVHVRPEIQKQQAVATRPE